jgi:hypothetical protein
MSSISPQGTGVHSHCTLNWVTSFKTPGGAENLAKREGAYAASCTPSGTGGEGEGAWLEAHPNADGTFGVTWHNCSKADFHRSLVATVTVTLNGNRAAISGFNNYFATVTDLTNRLSAEWSWEAVRYVIANKAGAFKS